MNYIRVYEKYVEEVEDTIYIFDFDKTLVQSPDFEDLAIPLLEGVTINSLINSSIKRIGVSREDLKHENGRIYVDDPDLKIEIKGNWIRKGTRVYMVSPDRYYYTDYSFSTTTIKKVEKIYREAKWKAIVTGRYKDLKPKVEAVLLQIGLELPNCGLFCYPRKVSNKERVAEWKARVIVDLIRDNNFDKAIYYEDNRKWIRAAKTKVNAELPHVDFKTVKV